jgi:hypothetical protein
MYSCKSDEGSRLKFYKAYNIPNNRGMDEFDTSNINPKEFTNQVYYLEKIVSDSETIIIGIENKKTYFLDTSNCEVIRMLKRPKSRIYLRKSIEYPDVKEKTSISISAYYSLDTANLIISETQQC